MLALAALIIGTAQAQDADSQAFIGNGRLGVGVATTTSGSGVSAKLMLDERFGVQGTLLRSHRFKDEVEYKGFGLGADLTCDMGAIRDLDFAVIGWNLGAGLTLGTGLEGEGEDSRRGYATGISAIAGLQADFRTVPVDVVLEYRPSFGTPPDFDWDPLGFYVHARWWF